MTRYAQGYQFLINTILNDIDMNINYRAYLCRYHTCGFLKYVFIDPGVA